MTFRQKDYRTAGIEIEVGQFVKFTLGASPPRIGKVRTTRKHRAKLMGMDPLELPHDEDEMLEIYSDESAMSFSVYRSQIIEIIP